MFVIDIPFGDWIIHPVKKYMSYKLKKMWGRLGSGAQVCNPDSVMEPQNIFIGDNTIILDHARLHVYNHRTGLKSRIMVGKHCYLGTYLTLYAGADLIIHDDVIFSNFVTIVSENHGMSPETELPYMDQPLLCAPIEIEDGVWIGDKVSVLPGVRIGKKSIVGANAVVTHDIPAYSIAAGNPARVIKKYDLNTHKWLKV